MQHWLSLFYILSFRSPISAFHHADRNVGKYLSCWMVLSTRHSKSWGLAVNLTGRAQASVAVLCEEDLRGFTAYIFFFSKQLHILPSCHNTQHLIRCSKIKILFKKRSSIFGKCFYLGNHSEHYLLNAPRYAAKEYIYNLAFPHIVWFYCMLCHIIPIKYLWLIIQIP